ncbi:hypothetical protein BDM02DRAFT_3119645 [Thelephora ganbajun]|uniref:Uncharacterized protein n=1 Tax=Thelephora ganbajun TaxID=370292 RepID=A0ACB6Z877_THEGA|nr:hypothetical protein BDM02DRAFT_3119645 [Thelephora ganbajun]
MFAKLLLIAIALPALLVRADPTPSIPGPGDSYKQGGDCAIEWDVDTTGKWTKMQIELKTGNNLAMVPLKVITTVDATKETKYVYPCPKVSPNSAIYFYEFTSTSSTEKYWTTRFTITDEKGNSTPPTESTQPNGDKIPWGTGTLVSDGSSSLGSSSSSLSSLPPSSSSGLSESSSRISSSSRLTSTRTPTPTQTGVNTGSSQGSSNSDMAAGVSKVLVLIGLVTASTAFI